MENFKYITVKDSVEPFFLYKLKNENKPTHYAIEMQNNQVEEEQKEQKEQKKQKDQEKEGVLNDLITLINNDENVKEKVGDKIYIYDNRNTVFKVWNVILKTMGIRVIENEQDWENYLLEMNGKRIYELRMQWEGFTNMMQTYPPNLKILDLSGAREWKEVGSLLFLSPSIEHVVLHQNALREALLPNLLPSSLEDIVIINESYDFMHFVLSKDRYNLYRYNTILFETNKTDGELTVYTHEDWEFLQIFLINEPLIKKLIFDIPEFTFEILKLPRFVTQLHLGYVHRYNAPLSFLDKQMDMGKLKTIILNNSYNFQVNDLTQFTGTIIITFRKTNSQMRLIFENNLGLFRTYINMLQNAQRNGSITISTKEQIQDIWEKTPIDLWSNVHTLIVQISLSDIVLDKSRIPLHLTTLDISQKGDLFPKFLILLASLPKSCKTLYLHPDHRQLFPISFTSRILNVFVGKQKFMLPQQFKQLQHLIQHNIEASQTKIEQNKEEDKYHTLPFILDNSFASLSNGDYNLTNTKFQELFDIIKQKKQYTHISFIPMYLFKLREKQLKEEEKNQENQENRKEQKQKYLNSNEQKQERKQEMENDKNKRSVTKKKDEHKDRHINNNNNNNQNKNEEILSNSSYYSLVWDEIFEFCIPRILSLDIVYTPKDLVSKVGGIVPENFNLPLKLWTKEFITKATTWIHLFFSDKEFNSKQFANEHIQFESIQLGITLVSVLYLFMRRHTSETLRRELLFFQTISHPLADITATTPNTMNTNTNTNRNTNTNTNTNTNIYRNTNKNTNTNINKNTNTNRNTNTNTNTNTNKNTNTNANILTNTNTNTNADRERNTHANTDTNTVLTTIVNIDTDTDTNTDTSTRKATNSISITPTPTPTTTTTTITTITTIFSEYEQYLETLFPLSRVLCVLQHWFLYYGRNSNDINSDWLKRLRLICFPNKPLDKIRIESDEHGHPTFSFSETIDSRISQFLPHPEPIERDLRLKSTFHSMKLFESSSKIEQKEIFVRVFNRQMIFMTQLVNHTLWNFTDSKWREMMWGKYGDEDIALLYRLKNSPTNERRKGRNPIGLYFTFLSYQIFLLLLRISKPLCQYPLTLFRGMSRIASHSLVSSIGTYVTAQSETNKKRVLQELQILFQDRQSKLFTATSTAFDTAMKFAQGPEENGVRLILKYHLPPHYPFLVLNDFFQFSFNEQELLLPPDERWKAENFHFVSSGKENNDFNLLLVDMKLSVDIKPDMKGNKSIYFPEALLTQQQAFHELNMYLEEWIVEIARETKNEPLPFLPAGSQISIARKKYFQDSRHASCYSLFRFFQEFMEFSSSSSETTKNSEIVKRLFASSSLNSSSLDSSSLNSSSSLESSSLNSSSSLESSSLNSSSLDSSFVTYSAFKRYIKQHLNVHKQPDLDLIFFGLYQNQGAMTVVEKWKLEKQSGTFEICENPPPYMGGFTFQTFRAPQFMSNQEMKMEHMTMLCYMSLSKQVKCYQANSFCSFEQLLDRRTLFFESESKMKQFFVTVKTVISQYWDDQSNETIKKWPWILYFCWYWGIEAIVWKESRQIYVSFVQNTIDNHSI